MTNDLRVPPQALDSERALIGSLLLAPHFLDEVPVTSDDFYSEANEILFSTICQMWDRGVRGIDVVTVGEELARTGKLERAGGPQYLHEILETVPHAAHVLYYAEHVTEAARKRRIIIACTDAMQAAYMGQEKADDIVSKLDHSVLTLQDLTGGNDIETIGQAVDELEEMENNPAAVYPSGLESLDGRLARNGFLGRHLIVIAARPGGGKSALTGQIARYSAERNVPSLVISLEMAKSEIAERYSSTVDRKSLRGLPLYFAESAFSIDRIRQVIRLAVRKHRVKVVAVDYLQLVGVNDVRKSRDLQIAEVSRGLKLLAKEMNIPILVGCQLNRGSEKENRPPRLIDLRESGAIEQDADIVLLLHDDGDGNSQIIMAKQRGGRTSSFPVVFDKMRTIFRDKDIGEGFKF